jgi:4-hydroxybenzoate polyprenyltransferase
MRFDKPIGTLLLLWPTLWALWLASAGHPNPTVLLVFVLGVVTMRAAGCVMNDFADRHVDGHVERTKHRPLASGKVTSVEAIMLFSILMLGAFGLVLFCNVYTIELAFIGAALAVIYPFLKRVTHLPQLGLGAAFMWSIPMAFAAETGSVSGAAWFLFITGIVWPVIYDTMYAMVDRNDDMTIGIKSTAILFGDHEALIIGILQAVFISMMIVVGVLFHLHAAYYAALVIAAGLFVRQQWLLQQHDPKHYFQAFLNNNWVGAIIFLGIGLSYLS